MPVESGGSSTLPLPSGASTLAEQQTHTTRLGTISTNTGDAASDTDAIRTQTDDLETISAAIRDRLPATLGQKTSAASTSVTLASDGIADAIEKQGRSANTPTWTNVSVSAVVAQLASVAIADGRGILMKNSDRRTLTIWVGRSNAITAADDSVSPVWPIEPGEEAFFDVANSNELYVIATGATAIITRIENRT